MPSTFNLAFDTELSVLGHPLPSNRIRWVHACGRRGKWMDAHRAKIGGHSHDRRCRKPPAIEAGRRYVLESVAGGWNRNVIVREGEKAGVLPPPRQWLLEDRDDVAGARWLVDLVHRAGGILVNEASLRLPPLAAVRPR
jgi:hypothetical protein